MKTTRLLLTFTAAGSLFLASCGSTDHANEAESPEAPALNRPKPRLTGSHTAKFYKG